MTSHSVSATIGVLRQVFSAHGLPESIVSEYETGFTITEYLELLTRNRIPLMLVQPWHPVLEDAPERVVQIIKL